jgi:ABC-2 type transport system ATP-binding protein
VRGPDPERLADEMRARFGGSPRLLDGAVLIERPRAHEFLVEMLPALSGRIESVAVRRPTLEDLFIARTGHRFWAADDGAGGAP